MRTSGQACLALGSEVTDASVGLVGAVCGFDPDPPETTITRFVDRSVVQAILVSQFVGDLGISGIQSVKGCRLVKATSRGSRQLRQVLLTSIQHSQSFAQIVYAKLVEPNNRVRATHQ